MTALLGWTPAISNLPVFNEQWTWAIYLLPVSISESEWNISIYIWGSQNPRGLGECHRCLPHPPPEDLDLQSMINFTLIRQIFRNCLLRSLKGFNAMSWPEGVAISFVCKPHHWLMLYTLGLCIVNVHWCSKSDGFFNFTFRKINLTFITNFRNVRLSE